MASSDDGSNDGAVWWGLFSCFKNEGNGFKRFRGWEMVFRIGDEVRFYSFPTNCSSARTI